MQFGVALENVEPKLIGCTKHYLY